MVTITATIVTYNGHGPDVDSFNIVVVEPTAQDAVKQVKDAISNLRESVEDKAFAT